MSSKEPMLNGNGNDRVRTSKNPLFHKNNKKWQNIVQITFLRTLKINQRLIIIGGSPQKVVKSL